MEEIQAGYTLVQATKEHLEQVRADANRRIAEATNAYREAQARFNERIEPLGELGKALTEPVSDQRSFIHSPMIGTNRKKILKLLQERASGTMSPQEVQKRFPKMTIENVRKTTVPLYTSLFRAVLGLIDYGVHLTGQTGKGKSELCALVQQHFGTMMTARRLPGSWLSTENALEMLMLGSMVQWNSATRSQMLGNSG